MSIYSEPHLAVLRAKHKTAQSWHGLGFISLGFRTLNSKHEPEPCADTCALALLLKLLLALVAVVAGSDGDSETEGEGGPC